MVQLCWVSLAEAWESRDVLKAVSYVGSSVFKQRLNPSRLKPQDALPPSQELLPFQAQRQSG